MAQYANCGENEQAIPVGGNAAGSFQGECKQSDTQLQGTGDNGVGALAANLGLAGSIVVAVVVSLL